jgi:hypothetical protein
VSLDAVRAPHAPGNASLDLEVPAWYPQAMATSVVSYRIARLAAGNDAVARRVSATIVEVFEAAQGPLIGSTQLQV